MGIGLPRLPVGLIQQNDLQAVASLFANGAPGVWFDRQDLSSMYQDASGTTACAVGSPVGLALDKSKGAVRGVENAPATTSTTGWGAGTGTSQIASNGTSVTLTNGDATEARLTIQGFAPAAGNWYELTLTVDAVSSGGAYVTGGNRGTLGGVGVKRFIFQSAGTFFFATNSTTAGNLLTVRNVSIRELPGNHATQGTSASRFVLTQDAAGRYYAPWDAFDDSMTTATGGGATTGFFFCAGITVSGGAATARTLWSDAGTNAGYRVRVNATNQLELAAGNGVAFTTVATVATLPVGETHVVTAWDDGTNLNVQIDSGAIASVARPAVSAGTAGFTIAKDNGTASSFYNGRDYGMVYRTGTVVSATERERTKRFMAGRSGAVL